MTLRNLQLIFQFIDFSSTFGAILLLHVSLFRELLNKLPIFPVSILHAYQFIVVLCRLALFL